MNGVRIHKPVLREINDVNSDLLLARVYAHGDGVWVEGCLPVETLRAGDLRALCAEVGATADKLGSLLATVYGGVVAFPDAAEAGYEHED